MSEHANILTPSKQTSPLAAISDVAEPALEKEQQQLLPIQCSLTVGAPDDPLEHEADAMADTVMRMPMNAPGSFQVPDAFNGIQRKCAHCEEEETAQRKPLAASVSPFIQTKNNGAATTSSELTGKINSSRGSGTSLDEGTKTFMESRFGSDFSSVKIHTGNESVMMNRELNAKAFTVGNDIYFNEGQYNPQSDSGKHLLAHELTHTLQQGNGTKAQRQIQRQIANVRVEGDARRTSPEGGVTITNGTLTWTLRFVGQVDTFRMGETDPGTPMEGTDVIMDVSFTPANASHRCPTITFIQIVRATTNGFPDTARLLFTRDAATGFSPDINADETEPYYGLGYNRTSNRLEPDMSNTLAGTAPGRSASATFADGPKHPTSAIPAGQSAMREFEVAVICVETGQTFGSIIWGYTKTSNGVVTLTGAQAANVQTTAATANVENARQAYYQGFFQHSIHSFARGSAVLTRAQRTQLTQIAGSGLGLLQEIVLVGSNDFSGGSENNVSLSLQRAEAVKAFLVTQGIDASKIRTEGHGVTARVPNAAGQQVAENRRVDMHIVRGNTVIPDNLVPGSANEAMTLRRADPLKLAERVLDILNRMEMTHGTIPVGTCDSLTNTLDALEHWRATMPNLPDLRRIYHERIVRLRSRCESRIPRAPFEYTPPPLVPPNFIERIGTDARRVE